MKCVGIDCIDIPFIQDAEGDRARTCCLDKMPFRFELLWRWSQSYTLRASCPSYASYTYNALAAV